MSKDHLKKIWTGPTTGEPKPIIYLSGPFEWEQGTDALKLLRYFCQSYFYSHTRRELAIIDLMKQNNVRCFLDSGAFSYQNQAMKQGKSITQQSAAIIIDQYVDWVYKIDRVFDFIVTFDYVRDADITDWATKRIEARGLNPLSVYHYGAPISALHDLIGRYSHIGIGGMVGTNTKYLRPFLDHVFNLTEKHGTKLHGFGVGGGLIALYPWFSVDSTTWLREIVNGMVRVPGTGSNSIGDKLFTSQRSAVIKNEDLESRCQRAAHNIRFWVDYMYRLSARESKPQAKKALF